MSSFVDRAGEFLRTLQALAQVRGGNTARLLQDADATLLATGYDNWDGGTDLYTFELAIPARTFAELEHVQDELERIVLEQLRKILRTETGVSLTEVVIRPVVPSDEPHPSADDGIWVKRHFVCS